MLDILLLATTWGFIVGIIYSITALGLTIIFGATKIVNFIHGDFVITAAYVTLLISALGITPYLAFIPAILLLALIAIPTYKMIFEPLLAKATKLHEIIASIGGIFIVQNVLASIFSTNYQRIETPLAYLRIEFPITLPYDQIIVLIIGGCSIILLHFFITKTMTGRALEATSQDEEGSWLVGVNVKKIRLISFILGLTLAAVGGTSLSLIYTYGPYDGVMLSVKAFAITILGGMGNIKGTFLAGLFYGVSESFVGAFLGGTWKEPFAFLLMVVVLALRGRASSYAR